MRNTLPEISHLSLAEAAAAAGSKNAVTAYMRDVLASRGVVGPLATELEAAWAANASRRMSEASQGALTVKMAKLLVDHKPASVQVPHPLKMQSLATTCFITKCPSRPQEARAIIRTDASDAEIARALAAMCERTEVGRSSKRS